MLFPHLRYPVGERHGHIMKLRLTLALPQNTFRDVTVECGAMATVQDVARAIIRTGVMEDEELLQLAITRCGPLTLLGRPTPERSDVMFDPASTLGAAGLKSGWLITPTTENIGDRAPMRAVPIVGTLEVLDGAQQGAIFTVIKGTNVIGRDLAARIHLLDRSVSRRHASLQIDESVLLQDLGSVNGTHLETQRVRSAVLSSPCTLEVGSVRMRFTTETPSHPPAELSPGHRILHVRPPRVSSTFPTVERVLPAPPQTTPAHRAPILAVLAPVMLGAAMFLVTRSPMSLMMMAFSPLLMAGTWIDGIVRGKADARRHLKEFSRVLQRDRHELAELREQEVTVRLQTSPATEESVSAINDRSSLLWARRPEQNTFLEVRFGLGASPSRVVLKAPDGHEGTPETTHLLQTLQTDFAQVSPVPVVEGFTACGSIGIAGPTIARRGLVRALVLQLAGLHSPAELSVACVTSPRESASWHWLKWLPHVNSALSPISGHHLTDSEPHSIHLIQVLERLIADRRSWPADPATAGSQHTPIPAIVVLVLGTPHALSRLITIAEQGPKFGVHVLWVAEHPSQLPAACRTYAQVDDQQTAVHYVQSGRSVQLVHAEHCDMERARAAARSIAALEDAGANQYDESDLPAEVRLAEIHDADLLGGGLPVLQSWRDTDSVINEWQQGETREAGTLSAIVGQGTQGRLSIDLRTEGPHALVGGTTGSGKSEFLRTWIMSLAARYSPDRVTFLLIDYKGGAAFAECVDLPHTVGLVTDLTPRLVHRALTSLRAEIRYREGILARHEAKDLSALERRSERAAPPSLCIVIDEFAALATDVPEFIDGVVDIAQRGRSLGLHLILATQRPAGVITDNLRANTNLRIALRLADPGDSIDVIGVPHAAHFDIAHPGRAALSRGAGNVTHFQSAHLGVATTLGSRTEPIAIRSLEFQEGRAWDIPSPPEHHGATDTRPSDSERLRGGIQAAVRVARIRQPRIPWLDELPSVLPLRDLEQRTDRQLTEADIAVIGLRDSPSEQAQYPVRVNFDAVGNVALFGAGASGKTTALFTIAAATSAIAAGHPIAIYGIDGAGGALDALSSLPTVGTVVQLNDLDRVERVLQHLLDAIAERIPRFADARAENIGAYRQLSADTREPRILLLLDGFDSFRQASEESREPRPPMTLLNEIMQTGRAVGVHVVLTGSRPLAVPAAMSATIQQQFILRLAANQDYSALGVPAHLLEDTPPGRAVIPGVSEEMQFAVVAESPGLLNQDAAITARARELTQNGVAEAKEIRALPTRILAQDLPPSPEGPVVALQTRHFGPVTMPQRGLAVLTGPAGAGLSTTAQTCVEAFAMWAVAQGTRAERLLLTFTSDGLRKRAQWDRVALGEAAVSELAWEIVEALGGTRPRTTAFSMHTIGEHIEEPRHKSSSFVFPRRGNVGIVVVERAAEVEGAEAITALVALTRVARRANVMILFEFEQGSSHGAWELRQALKRPRWGIVLHPDPTESSVIYGVSYGRRGQPDMPPGRGVVVSAGRPEPIQVALPDSFTAPDDKLS